MRELCELWTECGELQCGSIKSPIDTQHWCVSHFVTYTTQRRNPLATRALTPSIDMCPVAESVHTSQPWSDVRRYLVSPCRSDSPQSRSWPNFVSQTFQWARLCHRYDFSAFSAFKLYVWDQIPAISQTWWKEGVKHWKKKKQKGSGRTATNFSKAEK